MTKKRTYALKAIFSALALGAILFAWAVGHEAGIVRDTFTGKPFFNFYPLVDAGVLAVLAIVCAILALAFKDGTEYEERK